MNWGSASYDPENRRLFVNDIRLVNTRRIIPRAEYEAIAKVRPPTPDGHGLAAMEGTPYGVLTGVWYSALGVRRLPGLLPARLRRRDRRGAVEVRAARRLQRHADELHLPRRPAAIRRRLGRRRRPRQGGRRLRHGLRAAEASVAAPTAPLGLLLLV